eukprot:9287454-Pyramimonas_sp.AAC.1
MELARWRCDEYGTPADIYIFQMLEHAQEVYTPNETIIATQLLFLKWGLKNAEDEDALVGVLASGSTSWSRGG